MSENEKKFLDDKEKKFSEQNFSKQKNSEEKNSDGWRERHRNYMAKKSLEKTRSFNDIGKIPDIVNLQRRERANQDFALWRHTYCLPRHKQADSLNHQKMCERLQEAIESREGWFGIQAPRGEAKTTTIMESIGWAIASGRKKFPFCFSSSAATMTNLVTSFKSIFQDLPLIFEDYPEISYPLKILGDSKTRQLLYQENPIRIKWAVNDKGKIQFHFPDISESPSQFAHLIVSPINTKFRGFSFADADGRIRRPDLVLFDDIQDGEIAANPDRVTDHWNKMTIDAVGLSGDDPMPMINSGTPFNPDCLMSRTMKDRRFNGITLKSIYKFPTNMDFWYRYQKIWEDVYDEKVAVYGIYEKNRASSGAFEAASKFYLEHRETMDAGIEMSWPARYETKYSGASAIENIMREYLLILGPDAFDQEKNCEVKSAIGEDVEEITEELFLSKIDNSLKWLVSPKEAELITYAIDVHKNILYYEGVAWSSGFDGHVIDFGTFPEQPNQNFSQKKVKTTLKRRYLNRGDSGALLAGLNDLVQKIMTRHYMREDGSQIYVKTILVDNNNGDFQDVVTKFSEESEFREQIICYLGQWYSSGTQIKKQKEKGGTEWKWSDHSKKTVVAFRDWWKSYNHDRWLTARGDAGCKTIYSGGPQQFRKFYSELTAQIYKWIALNNGVSFRRWPKSDEIFIDDHYCDTDFMNTLAASVCGIKQESERYTKSKRKREKVKLSQLQQERRESGYV